MSWKGVSKITEVELPIYKLTPLYARYFLYAGISVKWNKLLTPINVVFR